MPSRIAILSKYNERWEQRQTKTEFSSLTIPNRILLLSKYTEIIMRNFLLHQTTFHKNTRNTSYFLMNKFITSLFSENLLISGLQTPIIITHRRNRHSPINGWKARTLPCEGREGGNKRRGCIFRQVLHTLGHERHDHRVTRLPPSNSIYPEIL